MSKIILDNIAENIEQIAIFNEEAKQKPKNKREPYYKASLFFAASTVEAFVYLIIKKYCSENEVEYGKKKKYRQIHRFPDQMFVGTTSVVGIYEQLPEPFEWRDNIDFDTMNNIGKKYKIFNSRFHKKLDVIRVKRNNIHIQSLEKQQASFTKKDINYVGSAIPKLIDLSKKYGITS